MSFILKSSTDDVYLGSASADTMAQGDRARSEAARLKREGRIMRANTAGFLSVVVFLEGGTPRERLGEPSGGRSGRGGRAKARITN
jgi:hypothetical protein